MTLAAKDALGRFAAEHGEWTVADSAEGGTISREHKASSAREALRLIQRIGDLAEGANHHPELTWVYNRLEIALTTHDAGGLTSKDLHLAACIDDILA